MPLDCFYCHLLVVVLLVFVALGIIATSAVKENGRKLFIKQALTIAASAHIVNGIKYFTICRI